MPIRSARFAGAADHDTATRRPQRRAGPYAALAVRAASVATFIHCILPVLWCLRALRSKPPPPRSYRPALIIAAAVSAIRAVIVGQLVNWLSCFFAPLEAVSGKNAAMSR